MSRPDTPIGTIDTEAYRIPTDQPEADGTLTWSSTTLILARITAGDTEGVGWTYADVGAKDVIDGTLGPLVTTGDPAAVPELHEDMVRACRNLGRPGEVSCAISAVDIALWDLKARLLDLPLADLWGRAWAGAPIYGSGGFTTYDDATTAGQLESWVEQGISRVKIKIGESWGSNPRRDLARVALARRTVGADVEVYVDANGAYTRKQAIRLGRRMTDEHDVRWFEEPVSSDDLVGLREVRDQCEADVAAGEYGYSPTYFAHLIAAEAVDCVQADATRCGGYTDWLTIAHLVAANGLQLSAHCAPNLHAHAAVTIPNLRHVEYFHDHTRIEELLFDGALVPSAGSLCPSRDRPGHGMTLRHAAAQPYRIA